MDVDYWGVVNGTKAFLPHLIASGDGHVINTSSIFGLFSVPGQAAYNSAKFAVRGFTEALRQEMILAGHPVKVTSVHPGGIKTAIARNSTAAEGLDAASMAEWFDAKMARTSSERAAEIILDGVAKGRRRQDPRRLRPSHRFGLSACAEHARRPVHAEDALKISGPAGLRSARPRPPTGDRRRP